MSTTIVYSYSATARTVKIWLGTVRAGPPLFDIGGGGGLGNYPEPIVSAAWNEANGGGAANGTVTVVAA